MFRGQFPQVVWGDGFQVGAPNGLFGHFFGCLGRPGYQFRRRRHRGRVLPQRQHGRWLSGIRLAGGRFWLFPCFWGRVLGRGWLFHRWWHGGRHGVFPGRAEGVPVRFGKDTAQRFRHAVLSEWVVSGPENGAIWATERGRHCVAIWGLGKHGNPRASGLDGQGFYQRPTVRARVRDHALSEGVEVSPHRLGCGHELFEGGGDAQQRVEGCSGRVSCQSFGLSHAESLSQEALRSFLLTE